MGRVWYENGVKRRHVLVVDDEPDVRSLVVDLLARDGYAATSAADGREALRALYEVRPDLVILDVRMPQIDGWRTLERIRELSDVPVLMLTARDGELDKVRGFKTGADDYVGKPFGRQELLARVEALLRRAAPSPELRETYADGLISIDFEGGTATVAGREVNLTPTEFRLLATFTRHPNQVLSRDQLLELVWADGHGGSNDAVKLYVGYLRRKLAAAGGDASPIETVRGFGYRYRPPVARDQT
jgi:DNA-binding response OmpR family regulator